MRRRTMRGTVLYGPRDIRFEDRETPKIVEPTDALIRISLTCVCGSDLWPYRGLQPINGPTPMGHEYCGFVEEVGSAVRSVAFSGTSCTTEGQARRPTLLQLHA